MLRVKFYNDTLFSDDTSVQGNRYDQIYADRDVFVHVFLTRSKAGAGDSLGNVFRDIGIMNEIHCYNSLEQVGTNEKFMSKARKYITHVSSTKT